MEKSIVYGYVSLFPQCKDSIEKSRNADEEIWKRYCDKIDLENARNNISNIKKLCAQALPYLFEIYYYPDDPLKSVGCKYLYYWLNINPLLKKNKGTTINNIYNEILNVYNTNHKVKIINQECNNPMTDEDIIKLKELYDLYICLHKVKPNNSTSDHINSDCSLEYTSICKKEKENCQNDNTSDFCKALENSKKYYTTIKLGYDSYLREHLQSSIINNNLKPIVATVTIILILSLLLFIVFKFTPYGAYLCKGYIWLRRKYNNINEVFSILDPLDPSTDRICNILYHST
ncbi:variable surface protein [Plasmodium gonderi]|uniref:Variable surface protein n=1 Tax=Plasmodium gonderi TaxID=77519 RepID=A0A1Y1JPD6_PLAGO|nr:variable surface protein [Plasmodium gonderi]GAW84466.1 variable surface protein [Plasmodium gonderi]